jgi:hypothetical protein
VRIHFFLATQAYAAHSAAVDSLLSNCQAAAKQDVQKLLKNETARPFWTQNGHYYESQSLKWRNEYRRGREYSQEQDPYRDEINLMADGRAYFQVAYKVRTI